MRGRKGDERVEGVREGVRVEGVRRERVRGWKG